MPRLADIRLGTSYFARAREVPCPVSIARSEPAWFKTWQHFRSYKKLAPSWKLIQSSKQGKVSWMEYKAAYQQQVLDGLDPEQVLLQLTQSFGPELTLLCWEREAEFCHRRLAARWLGRGLGLDIPEL
ncbi:MAG: DUF488 family protein [Desulfohalobiaceae bacterium]